MNKPNAKKIAWLVAVVAADVIVICDAVRGIVKKST